MITDVILVTHIAVLGYWLGSELVINSTYRYACYSADMAFPERARLMDHVMHIDQHVRYALALQATLGTALAALYGYIPGGENLALIAGFAGGLWLTFIEITHRLRDLPVGKALSAVDRWSRLVLMLLLLGLALGLVGESWPMPTWLHWKLAMFACVMACGVGIRFALIAHFRTWAIMAREGPDAETNAIIKRTYVKATSILILLWGFIGAIVYVSIWKPM